jgi:uncharacterized membrane protein YphA (DoxX/SURF4 family)
MPRRGAEKYTEIKKIIGGVLIIVAGCFLFANSYDKPNLSWERMNWLIISLLAISWGLALFTSKGKTWANLSRIFVGLVFTYSGFVKAVDPLGSAYKFTEYFESWHLKFMEPYAVPLAIILSVSELVVGLALLFNLFLEYAALGALIFMVYFTPVTMYLGFQENLSGKELVHDCGCFGDALILTNWQTFFKNLFLLIPTIYIFKKRKFVRPILLESSELIMIGTFVVAGLGIAYIGIEHLPIIDFRPYKIGTNIQAKMQIPAGAPQPKYEYHLYYKNNKTGEKKEFNLENYPKDSSWTFVDTKNVLIEEGYVPAIHDFSIVNATEGDITQTVLSDQNYNFLVVCYDINKTSLKHIKEINMLYNWCKSKGLGFRCLTSSVERDIEFFKKKSKATFPFYTTDAITLKTIVRSNPGLVMLKTGTVKDMWHHNDIPKIEYFSKFIN